MPQFTGSNAQKWSTSSFPIQWNINPTIGSNVSGSTPVTTVINNSFATWLAAPNTTLPASQGASSSVTSESSSPKDVNLICFVCSDVDFGGGTDTLAETITTTTDGAGGDDYHGGSTQFAGQIIKADIAFNPAVQFDTGGGTGQDLQTVATHEVGHFFGLDHSAVISAVMYPTAPTLLTTLSYDDVAGISLLYPQSTQDVATGTISGTVTLNGSPVFGAHVVANSTTSANAYSGFNVRKSPIGILTLTDGTYTINQVPPDSYLVIAEPLDLPVSNSDVSWASEFGQGAVQTNFTTRWH
ncbi:MAG: matrixin family metalloprotease [Acidobacteriales bacterium]|nr:matrixin family metalloprotease [Terriglobales bacterium]